MAPYLSLEQCNIHKHRAGQHNKQNSLQQAFKKITNISKEAYNEEVTMSYYFEITHGSGDN